MLPCRLSFWKPPWTPSGLIRFLAHAPEEARHSPDLAPPCAPLELPVSFTCLYGPVSLFQAGTGFVFLTGTSLMPNAVPGMQQPFRDCVWPHALMGLMIHVTLPMRPLSALLGEEGTSRAVYADV